MRKIPCVCVPHLIISMSAVCIAVAINQTRELAENAGNLLQEIHKI